MQLLVINDAVSTVRKPPATFLWSNAQARLLQRADRVLVVHEVQVVLADPCFDCDKISVLCERAASPRTAAEAVLDGVQVRGVRRKREDAAACRFHRLAQDFALVDLAVVHNKHTLVLGIRIHLGELMEVSCGSRRRPGRLTTSSNTKRVNCSASKEPGITETARYPSTVNAGRMLYRWPRTKLALIVARCPAGARP